MHIIYKTKNGIKTESRLWKNPQDAIDAKNIAIVELLADMPQAAKLQIWFPSARKFELEHDGDIYTVMCRPAEREEMI